MTTKYIERIQELADRTREFRRISQNTIPEAALEILNHKGIFDPATRKKMHHDICSVLGAMGGKKAQSLRRSAKKKAERAALQPVLPF